MRIVVQFAIGIVFLLSSEEKLRDRGSFTEAVAAYRMVPRSWTYFTALFIVGLEAFLAASHLTGYFLRLGLIVGLGLIALFAVAVTVNLRRGRALPCYCFGAGGATISVATLVRLSLLASGEAFLLKMYQPIYPVRMALLQIGFALFWSILLLVAGLWLFALEDVIRLLKPET